MVGKGKKHCLELKIYVLIVCKISFCINNKFYNTQDTVPFIALGSENIGLYIKVCCKCTNCLLKYSVLMFVKLSSSDSFNVVLLASFLLFITLTGALQINSIK